MPRFAPLKLLPPALALLCLASPAPATEPDITGRWVINEELSDNTDRQVEESLRAAGRKVNRRLFGGEDQYRGGPEEQELYDRISYDDVLAIETGGDRYTFTYADDYTRPVYTDGRRRSVSLSDLSEVGDFSMGHWENGVFRVEARPRDGGFTQESYRLTSEGRLRVQLYIEPRVFSKPIEILRVYERARAQRP